MSLLARLRPGLAAAALARSVRGFLAPVTFGATLAAGVTATAAPPPGDVVVSGVTIRGCNLSPPSHGGAERAARPCVEVSSASATAVRIEARGAWLLTDEPVGEGEARQPLTPAALIPEDAFGDASPDPKTTHVLPAKHHTRLWIQATTSDATHLRVHDHVRYRHEIELRVDGHDLTVRDPVGPFRAPRRR
jgi:hypothetical protein